MEIHLVLIKMSDSFFFNCRLPNLQCSKSGTTTVQEFSPGEGCFLPFVQAARVRKRTRTHLHFPRRGSSFSFGRGDDVTDGERRGKRRRTSSCVRASGRLLATGIGLPFPTARPNPPIGFSRGALRSSRRPSDDQSSDRWWQQHAEKFIY
jgi:hypothetical protein